MADNANRAAKYSMSTLGTHMNKSRQSKNIQSKSARFAYDALEIFDKHPKAARRSFTSVAHKLIGFSFERDKDWFEAAMAYQKAMDIQRKYLTHEDAEFITTIGRWTNTRTHIMAEMNETEAIQKGLCECWPFEKAKKGYVSKRIAKPVKRKPPVMPRRATTSGFSFMRFDLDDSGKPINIEVRHSWPKKNV